MRVGFYQFWPTFGDVKGNLEQIAVALNGIEAELIVLPELASSGYLFLEQDEVNAIAEPVPGPTTEFVQTLARRHGCHIVIGLAERAGHHIYNSAVLIGPDGVVGTYRKVHLFYEEKNFFHPGDAGFPLFEIGEVKIGLLVCFDHLFPEAARTLAVQGAQVICHPSNLVLPEIGQLTTRVRAIENRVFWVLANRFGTEERGGKKLSYTGCSQIIAPDGTVLATAPAQEAAVRIVEIDPAQAVCKRITPLNDIFADRRPELYRLTAPS
ncbi:MAG: nitrilase-related carbon-nitrogen hydrolase [Acidobacteriota bacterium]|nr:acyltransferase [Blastocatellia bacterium]MDW8239498.1 nitrilase-related carbon-nitrogen hydrolase [Acidobacteriota bacterium]